MESNTVDVVDEDDDSFDSDSQFPIPSVVTKEPSKKLVAKDKMRRSNTIKVPETKTKNGQQLLSPSVSEADQESDQTSKGVE